MLPSYSFRSSVYTTVQERKSITHQILTTELAADYTWCQIEHQRLQQERGWRLALFVNRVTTSVYERGPPVKEFRTYSIVTQHKLVPREYLPRSRPPRRSRGPQRTRSWAQPTTFWRLRSSRKGRGFILELQSQPFGSRSIFFSLFQTPPVAEWWRAA